MGEDWVSGGDRHEQARDLIHDAALQVLAERGLEQFTAEAVARRAGCSRATLYRHVGGKRALLDALLLDAGIEIVGRVISDTSELTGVDRVTAGIVGALREVRANPAISEFVRRATADDLYLGRSREFGDLAARVTGVDHRDPLAIGLIHRLFVSLVVWPGENAEIEEQMVRRYIAPAILGSGGPSA